VSHKVYLNVVYLIREVYLYCRT